MHKIWLIVLFCVAALLLVLLGAPMFLERTVDLEASINVRATSERVFELLETPTHWATWSGWVGQDPTTVMDRPQHGPGSALSWKHGDNHETLHIAKTEPPAAVYYELLEDDHARFAGVFHLVGEGDQTHVVWRHSGAFGDGYFQPIVLFAIRDRVAASMHTALDRLRTAAEAAP